MIRCLDALFNRLCAAGMAISGCRKCDESTRIIQLFIWDLVQPVPQKCGYVVFPTNFEDMLKALLTLLRLGAEAAYCASKTVEIESESIISAFLMGTTEWPVNICNGKDEKHATTVSLTLMASMLTACAEAARRTSMNREATYYGIIASGLAGMHDVRSPFEDREYPDAELIKWAWNRITSMSATGAVAAYRERQKLGV